MSLNESSKIDFKQLMTNAKFFDSYSRYDEKLGRYETWDESVDRVMGMHRFYYADKMTPQLEELMLEVEKAYKEKLFLGSQRALQFGGEQLLKNHNKLYNCSATYCDRASVFGEVFHLMLSGCGVGFSVQLHHVAKMPKIKARGEDTVVFEVEDSIEGWANAVDVLMSSFFENGGKHPEYHGKVIKFDLTKIRPKGAHISGGFKAPGPDGLRSALDRIELLLVNLLKRTTTINTITAYDIIMHIADAVISGGVRRAATICLFSKEDKDMLNAKTGNWFITNPQRGRSNNSVVLLKSELERQEIKDIIEHVKEFGEPGFILVDSLEALYNPCVEIGMYAYVDETGETGFQFCNLTEINGGKSTTKEIFFHQCKVAAVMGTFQAGYTNFKFVSDATRKITEKEALLGESITGWMNNPDILFDEKILKQGAEIVKKWNKITAAMIGINQAARTTCVKPSGNASVLLGTASGIHGEHSKRYLRYMQLNKESEVAKLLFKNNPNMVEQSLYNPNDFNVSFPITTNPEAIFKDSLYGAKQLEYVVKAQKHWVDNGKNPERCTQPFLKHNVSNTIDVQDWDETADFIYDHREDLCGVSLNSATGDKAYAQSPFTEVLTHDQIVEKYGVNSMFTSALIEAGLDAFPSGLWTGMNTAMGFGEKPKVVSENAKMIEWIRRFKKFTTRFMVGTYGDDIKHSYKVITRKVDDTLLELDYVKDKIYELDLSVKPGTKEYNNPEDYERSLSLEDIKSSLEEVLKVYNETLTDSGYHKDFVAAMAICTNCVKDVYLLHKWEKINVEFKDFAWESKLTEKQFTEVDTIAGAACAGGQCDII